MVGGIFVVLCLLVFRIVVVLCGLCFGILVGWCWVVGSCAGVLAGFRVLGVWILLLRLVLLQCRYLFLVLHLYLPVLCRLRFLQVRLLLLDIRRLLLLLRLLW